jgi:PKD repeat protein
VGFGVSGGLHIEPLYTTYANGGEVHSIAYTGTANQAPVAAVKTTSPNYGAEPLTVSFDGSASRDANGDALTYLWNFGDGSTDQTTAPTTSHTYTMVPAGSYIAEFKVRDARGAVSAPATVKVFPGDSPPQPTIASPAAEKLFKVGDQITLSGSAIDPEDGQLGNASLSWEVRRHHNGNHWHPLLLQTGNNLSIIAPRPRTSWRPGRATTWR